LFGGEGGQGEGADPGCLAGGGPGQAPFERRGVAEWDVGNVRAGPEVHVICGNLSAHKAPAVHRWLLAHPRFVLHFTPAYSSWINQVERWLWTKIPDQIIDAIYCHCDRISRPAHQALAESGPGVQVTGW
jgi:DDE superfamily endonuclease